MTRSHFASELVLELKFVRKFPLISEESPMNRGGKRIDDPCGAAAIEDGQDAVDFLSNVFPVIRATIQTYERLTQTSGISSVHPSSD